MNRIESIAVLHLAKFECCVDSAAVLSASLAPRPPANGRARTQGPERELRLVKLEHIIPSCGTPRLSPKAFATAKSSPRLRPLTAGRQANSGAGQECFRFPNTSAPNRPPFCISDSSFISWHLQAFFHVLHQHLRLITTPFLFYLTFFSTITLTSAETNAELFAMTSHISASLSAPGYSTTTFPRLHSTQILPFYS